ncbi:MAG: NapH/MauN family ferredoxin-type protein [Burkholderiales bacterium]|jgi:ferredoxin-type protein NapH|nr:NapH/MauN family ferredoxin-type protein [Burkholderiales bacterium]
MSKQQFILAQAAPLWKTFVRDTARGRRLSLRAWRFLTVIGCLLLFVLSYRIDLQFLEGTLVGSRFIGLHLIDLFVTLQVFAAHHAIPRNLAIGTATVLVVYVALGGRSFCAWVCPYGILSEIGESIRFWLIEKKILKKGTYLPDKMKYVIWAAFLLASFLTGILVFEIFNVVGVIYRALLYGGLLSLTIVFLILLLEIFVSRRVWCRSVCPVGTTYGFLNPIALLKLKVNKPRCNNCGACTAVCHVPKALAPVFSKDEKAIYIVSTDCTLCGRCIDVCDEDALTFTNRLKNLV